ncbi:MAG: hypothetical protein ACRDSZ_02760 [Pseudonocardiaceae bacterium]
MNAVNAVNAVSHPGSYRLAIARRDWRRSAQPGGYCHTSTHGPTNGMTAENSARRREFQSRLLDYLATINHPALCVVGDLNVVEPNHQPRLPAFEEHDYAFYTGLLALGLRDAYRELNPAGGDHSWINPRFGSQRLDHTLVSVGAGEIRTCAYDHTTRADKLSDHAALLTTIGLRTY